MTKPLLASFHYLSIYLHLFGFSHLLLQLSLQSHLYVSSLCFCKLHFANNNRIQTKAMRILGTDLSQLTTALNWLWHSFREPSILTFVIGNAGNGTITTCPWNTWICKVDAVLYSWHGQERWAKQTHTVYINIVSYGLCLSILCTVGSYCIA